MRALAARAALRHLGRDRRHHVGAQDRRQRGDDRARRHVRGAERVAQAARTPPRAWRSWSPTQQQRQAAQTRTPRAVGSERLMHRARRAGRCVVPSRGRGTAAGSSAPSGSSSAISRGAPLSPVAISKRRLPSATTYSALRGSSGKRCTMRSAPSPPAPPDSSAPKPRRDKKRSATNAQHAHREQRQQTCAAGRARTRSARADGGGLLQQQRRLPIPARAPASATPRPRPAALAQHDRLGQQLGDVLLLHALFFFVRLEAVGEHRHAERAAARDRLRAGVEQLQRALDVHAVLVLLFHEHLRAAGAAAQALVLVPVRRPRRSSTPGIARRISRGASYTSL